MLSLLYHSWRFVWVRKVELRRLFLTTHVPLGTVIRLHLVSPLSREQVLACVGSSELLPAITFAQRGSTFDSPDDHPAKVFTLGKFPTCNISSCFDRDPERPLSRNLLAQEG